MDMLEFSLNGVGPICLLVVLGVLFRHIGLLDQGTARKMNKLCFQVLIPCKLFIDLTEADMTAAANGTLLALSLGGTAAVLLFLCLLVPRFLPAGPGRGEFIQGVFRSNTALLGIPLITNLYGDRAVAALALAMPLMLIFYNVAAPIILAVYSGGAKPSPKQTLKKVATNPFLIGVLLGVAFSLLKIPLPKFIVTTVKNLGSMGSPLALMALGAETELSEFREGGVTALIACALRLVLIPAVMLTLGALLGLRNEYLAVLVCFFSTPTAVGGYVLAQNVDGDGRLAGKILVTTTVLSMLTMFATLTLLRGLGLM